MTTPIEKNINSKKSTNTSIWRKRINNFFIYFCVPFLFVLCLCFIFLWNAEHFAKTPYNSSGKKKVFIIKPGQNLFKISENLLHDKLIGNSELFRLMVRFKKESKNLQAGEYSISSAMPPEKILNIFVSGKVKLHKLVIPEGLNINETATLVAKAGFGSKEHFIELAKNKAFARSMGIKGDSFEGYLFPETYFFPDNTSQKDIIIRMVKQFNRVFTTAWRKRAKKMGFSVHQIVTLASIIEKETGNARERPIIASVFYNRLKRKMPLESDPTVIYGIKNFNGDITKKDLKTKTPYNTYRIKGLPPGPIANPGRLSLKAALFPAHTDYLFFVSKNNSTHKFSKTLAEHNRAVRKYQLGFKNRKNGHHKHHKKN